jgi:ribosomal protein S18 acetylase RimI-like enzyme
MLFPSAPTATQLNNELTQIREATLGDLDDVQACARDAYSKYIDRIGAEPAPMSADFGSLIARGRVHVAVYQGQFAGYVVFYPEGEHLHLENVAVLPARAGKGIGRKLIEHVEWTARQQGFKSIELYTNEAMTENLAMYPKFGYLETGRTHQDGFDRVFFRKAL